MEIAAVTSTAARQAAFDIRRAVFIEEQSIPEAEEWDDADAIATHFLASDATGPAGTARLIPAGDRVKIGRVAVLPQWRGTGLGRRIMQAALDHAEAAGFRIATLEAQLHAIAFYERLGFVAEGPVFDDGSGILHRTMTRPLAGAAANRMSPDATARGVTHP